MPRQPRLHVPGGFYHVTLRGNHRAAIFRCDADRELLGHIVSEALERLNARLHAFCWMPNHLHLLVQIGTEPLGKLMQRIASRYAIAFQARLDTTGHLFERRYHALLVDADSYLLELLRYIHLNPVRAGLVEDPATYPWSSHRDYLGQRTAPWVTTAPALRLFSADLKRARTAYASFVSAPLADSPITEATINELEPRVLGDDLFVASLQAVPSMRKRRYSLEQLIDVCCRRYAVNPARVGSPRRDRELSKIRALVAYLANAHGIASVQGVARHFGRDESTLRRGVARLAGCSEDLRAIEDLLT